MRYFSKWLAAIEPSDHIQLDVTRFNNRVCVELHVFNVSWRRSKIICHTYRATEAADTSFQLLLQYVAQFNRQCIPQI